MKFFALKKLLSFYLFFFRALRLWFLPQNRCSKRVVDREVEGWKEAERDKKNKRKAPLFLLLISFCIN